MDKTSPKPFVFVLMPFSDEFNDVYQLGIKPACAEAGAYCERVDEQIYVENMLARIYNQIATAEFIIADLTGKNPNVFYETGYAHALGKTTILLIKDSADIPFDMKHYPHIVYGNSITKLKTELEKTLKWFIDNPQKDASLLQPTYQVYIENQLIEPGAELKLEMFYGAHEYKLRVYNSGSRVLSGEQIRFALVATESVLKQGKHLAFISPTGEHITMYGPIDTDIFPAEWLEFSIVFLRPHDELNHGEKLALKLRQFTEVGPVDIPFSAIIDRETPQLEAKEILARRAREIEEEKARREQAAPDAKISEKPQ